jgi:hypothetical protein
MRQQECRSAERSSFTELAWARDLFDQQLWCFGRDIIASERGNLLLEFGFDRFPHPHSTSIASIYQLHLSEGRSLTLRGFGVFWGDDRWGGLFVQRRSFRPQLTPHAQLTHPIWMSDDLPRLSRVTEQELNQASRLLATLCHWLADYERWVRRVAGEQYRCATIAQWTHNLRKGAKTMPADEMPDAWERLAYEASERPDRWLRAA